MVCVHESRIKREFVKSADLSKHIVNKSQPSSLVDPINERSSGEVRHDDDEVRDHSHDSVGQNSEDTDTQKGLDYESDSDYDPTEEPQEQVSDTDYSSVQNGNNSSKQVRVNNTVQNLHKVDTENEEETEDILINNIDFKDA